jgi:TRAP-type C4-dicarboxylate transport system permease small subunit
MVARQDQGLFGKVVDIMEAVNDRLHNVTVVIAAALVVMVVLIMSYEVVMRYAFRQPTIWCYDTARLILLVKGWIMMGYVLKKRRHISITALSNKLRGRAQDVLHLIVSSIGLIFSAFIVKWGLDVFWFSYRLGQTTETLQLPISVINVFIPIGGAFLGLQFFAQIIKQIRGLKKPAPLL